MTPKTTQTHPTVPPKVTVILPTYNRAAYLTQAIDSIRAQTLKDWELIIVDDASSDKTPEVVRDFVQQDPRIRYYRHNSNQGVATVRNTGLKHARGTYIAFQDDDDLSHPERLHRQVDYLDAHPHVVLLYTHMVNFSSDEAPPVSFYAQEYRPQINYATLMGPRAIYQKVLFRPFFFMAEDLDFTKRVTDYCRDKRKRTDIDASLKRPLYARRDHGYNVRLSVHHHHAIYCILCELSAAHRTHELKDPVDNARTIDDALNRLHPQFPNHLHRHHHLKKYIIDFILQYMTLPPTASPEQHQQTAWARHLEAHFAQHLFDRENHYLDIIKTHLHQAIHHNQLDTYKNILRHIPTYRLHHNPFLPLARQILSTCIERKRYAFILPYLLALVKKHHDTP